MLRWWLVLTVLIFLPGPASAAPVPAPVQATEEPGYRAPLVAIVADPARFNGHRVETTGYLHFDYGPEHLFISREDSEFFQILNGLALVGPEEGDRRAQARLNRKVVQVTGTYYWGPSGHMGMSRGVIVADQIWAEAPLRSLNIFYPYQIMLPGSGRSIGLPWLWLMLGLMGVTVGFGIWSYRSPRTGGTAPSPLAWKILAGVWTIYTLMEVEGSSAIFSVARLDYPLWWTLHLTLMVLGVIGLVGMWLALRRRRLTLCLAFMALQFFMPATREVLRLDTWQAQLTYPFYPDIENAKWERTQPAPPHRPRELGNSWENAPRPQDSD